MVVAVAASGRAEGSDPPHGMVAQDVGDDGPDHERRFDFAVTYNRELVVAAAKSLMRRIGPDSPAPAA